MATKKICDRCGTESTIGIKDYKNIRSISLNYIKVASYSSGDNRVITKDLCENCTKSVIEVISEILPQEG